MLELAVGLVYTFFILGGKRLGFGLEKERVTLSLRPVRTSLIGLAFKPVGPDLEEKIDPRSKLPPMIAGGGDEACPSVFRSSPNAFAIAAEPVSEGGNDDRQNRNRWEGRLPEARADAENQLVLRSARRFSLDLIAATGGKPSTPPSSMSVAGSSRLVDCPAGNRASAGSPCSTCQWTGPGKNTRARLTGRRPR